MQQSKVKHVLRKLHMREILFLFSSDNNCTFQTKDKIFRSLLDYTLLPEWITPEVKYMETFQELAYDVSDHFPLLCEIDIQNIFTHLPPDYSINIPKLKLADTNSLAAYGITYDNLSNSIDMILSSKDHIDMFLIHQTVSLPSSADEYIHVRYGNFNAHIKPYWKK